MEPRLSQDAAREPGGEQDASAPSSAAARHAQATQETCGAGHRAEMGKFASNQNALKGNAKPIALFFMAERFFVFAKQWNQKNLSLISCSRWPLSGMSPPPVTELMTNKVVHSINIYRARARYCRRR